MKNVYNRYVETIGWFKVREKRREEGKSNLPGKTEKGENLSFCSRSVETVGWIKGLKDLAGLQRTAFDPPLKRQG